MSRGPKPGGGMAVSVAKAEERWGADLPEWVRLLAEMADGSSQTVIAKEIGYSSSAVNAVINRTYTGDLGAVEKAVRGRFMSLMVQCPVLGELAANICLEHQKRAVKFSPSSTMRMQLAKACRGGCPNARFGKRPDGQ